LNIEEKKVKVIYSALSSL